VSLSLIKVEIGINTRGDDPMYVEQDNNGARYHDKAGLILRKITPNYYLSENKQKTAIAVIIFR